MQKLLSVIVPIYNTAPYLPRCIDSILGNGYENIEVILVDDGSSDNSLAVCRRYEAEHDCVCVLAKPNGGVHTARNAGLERAKGTYIVFIDSDDWCDKGMFSYLINVLEEHPEVCCAECGKRWHYPWGEKLLRPDEKHKNRICGREEALSLYIDNRLFHWGVHDNMFRRESIRRLRFEPGYAEDMRFHLPIFDENEWFFSSDDPETPKYNYNKTHDTNLTSQPFNPRHYQHLTFYLEFEQLANKYGYDALADRCFAEVCKRRVSFSSKALRHKHPERKAHFDAWKADARRDFKRAMRCRHLSPAFKADYLLFCAFPRLMRRVNLLLLPN